MSVFLVKHHLTPRTGELRSSVVPPEYLSMPRPRVVVGQNGLEKQYFAISRPWGSGLGKTVERKAVAEFRGETFWAAVFFSKSAPSTGRLCFSVFRPEFL